MNYKKHYLQELFCLYYGFLGSSNSPFHMKKEAQERLHKAVNTINCRVRHNIIKSYGNCPISFIPFASDNQVQERVIEPFHQDSGVD